MAAPLTLLRDAQVYDPAPRGRLDVLVGGGSILALGVLATLLALRDRGLPHGYYEILVRLSETPGRALRMTQLAEASTSSKSRLSHAVARLEDRGWIRRVNCPTDRRGQIAELTDAGFAALADAAPGHVEQVRRSLIDAIGPDQLAQLHKISEAITAAGHGQPHPPGGCGR